MFKKIILTICLIVTSLLGADAQRFMDTLDRGLIAIKQTTGVYVSWRIYGTEYYGVAYNLYRDGTKVNSTPLYVSNYTDASGTASSKYTVASVVDGVEQTACSAATVWANDYLVIPKATRISNDGISDITADFEPNDATFADVDGDGQMEVFVKEINDVDEASGFSTSSIDFDRIEVYKLDGTLLWWIDCGPNLSDFQHNETNIAVYDWDMDGKAEAVMRAADGTIIHMADGTTCEIGDKSKNYRSDMSSTMAEKFIHTGAEFLVYMNGKTGKPYVCENYPLKRLEDGETSLKAAWGDDYGHRSSKNFFGAPYLDGKKPSIFLARGIYTRHKMIALDVDPSTHQLTTRWTWNNNTAGSPWYGQGYHNYGIADVDWDGRDEIVFGSMVIDDDGLGLSTTGLGHGDAQHCGDFDPYTHGQEIYACNEDNPANNYRDATTSKIYYRLAGGSDDGRSMCGNFTNDVPGAIGTSGHDTFISCVTADHADILSNATGVTLNFRTYWDGDLLDESFNGTDTRNSNGAIYKYGKGTIKTFANTYTNNDSKATPCFQGDIFGDWREEIAMRDADNNIRIETTTIPTEYRNYTLLHDPQYRNAMVWQMNGYNQPPHVSYYLGEMEGITIAPPPATKMGKEEIDNGGSISSSYDDKQVLLDETSNATYSVVDGASPSILFDNAPTWVKGHDDNDGIEYLSYTHTLIGGAFTGKTRLVKQGDGTLTLPKVEQTYTGSTDVWAGTVNFDGTMKNSRVWLNRFAVLNSDGGVFDKGIQADYGATVRPGGNNKKGTLEADSLIMNFGSVLDIDIYDDGTSDKVTTNVLTLETKQWNVGPAYLAPRFNFVNQSDEIVPGVYTIAKVGKIIGKLDSVKLEGLRGHKAALSYDNGEIKLTIYELRQASSVTWTGAEDNTWNLADKENFKNSKSGESDVFVTGDDVAFNDGADNTSVSISEPITPSSVTFNNNSSEYSISGDSIVGTSSITKNDDANVNIDNVNTFRGTTTINGGSITVSSLGQTSGVNNGSLGYYTNTLCLNGGSLIPNTSMTGSHPITIGDNGGTINTPAGVTLTLDNSISGTGNVLTKEGSGTLKLAPTASYSKLIVNEGVVNGSENTSSIHAYPTTIVLNGGTLYDIDNIYSYSSNKANMVVGDDATASWYLDSRCDYKGTLTGAGTLNLFATGPRNYVNGNWSAFTGTINIGGKKTGSYDPVCLLNNSYGLNKATANVSISTSNESHNFAFGNLKGSGALTGSGTWTIGSLGDDVTYSGSVTGGKIIKTGDGVWTLSTLQSGVGGGTTVNAGVLNLTNSAQTQLFFGDYDVTVFGSGTLAGVAYLNNVYVNNGGTIAPGNYINNIKINCLKTKGSIFCYEGSTAKFFIRNNGNIISSRSFLDVGSSLSIKGNIVVEAYSNYSAKAGDEFTLWTAGSFSGTPANITLPTLPSGLEWDTTGLLNTTGIIKVVVATGISGLSDDAQFSGVLYTVNGIKIGDITTTKSTASSDVKEKVSNSGIYVIRVAGDSFKVVVK